MVSLCLRACALMMPTVRVMGIFGVPGCGERVGVDVDDMTQSSIECSCGDQSWWPRKGKDKTRKRIRCVIVGHGKFLLRVRGRCGAPRVNIYEWCVRPRSEREVCVEIPIKIQRRWTRGDVLVSSQTDAAVRRAEQVQEGKRVEQT
jgi:hypothetical protein